MKTYMFILSIMLMPFAFNGQDVYDFNDLNNLMIKNQKFEIYATRNEAQVHKSTKDLKVLLNYVTGAFYCGIQQKDLQLLSDEELPENVDRPDRPYIQIKGTMPVEIMQYDAATDQQYKVSLNLNIMDQEAPVVFDVYVKNYKQTTGGFRQFIGTADFDFRDIGITEFVGYNPRVKLVFSFQAFSKTN